MYFLPGVVLWYCTLRSGVHPTLAGVALGLLTPAGSFRGRRPLEELEHRVHPLASFVVLPLFALANAGVVLGGGALRDAGGSRLALAVILGLFVGKPAGIMLAGWTALRLKLAKLPEGVAASDLLPIGMVAGIGFTVSLFIAGLSFSGAVLEEAKTSILAASIVSALGGLGLIFLRSRRAGG
jgi:NhaA family Na+:H+ antiporter